MIRLRLIGLEDRELIWKWAKDPAARSASFASEPIPWADHVKWFSARVGNPDCPFFIALNEHGVPVGQIRFEVTGNEAVVSASVDNAYRGRGYGGSMIGQASERIFSESEVNLIHAYVKETNANSIRVFFKAGYRVVGEKEIEGQEAVHMILRRQTERCETC